MPGEVLVNLLHREHLPAGDGGVLPTAARMEGQTGAGEGREAQSNLRNFTAELSALATAHVWLGNSGGDIQN